jgi:hypothetical protein
MLRTRRASDFEDDALVAVVPYRRMLPDKVGRLEYQAFK